MATVDDIDFKSFFRELGGRLRKERQKKGWTQEDLIQHGFSARHYQMMEAGRPITIKTLLRLSVVFGVAPAALLRGIDVARRSKSGRAAPRGLPSRK